MKKKILSAVLAFSMLFGTLAAENPYSDLKAFGALSKEMPSIVSVKKECDLNGDGEITSYDALLILQMLVNTESVGKIYFSETDKEHMVPLEECYSVLFNVGGQYFYSNSNKLYLLGQNAKGYTPNVSGAVAARAIITSADPKKVTWENSSSNPDGILIDFYGALKNNKIILPFNYESATDYLDGIVAFCKDGKWGYVNDNGEEIIPFENDADECTFNEENVILPYLPSEGYIAVNNEYGGGFYGTDGKIIVPVGVFEKVRPVYNNKAWVRVNGKWGVITFGDDEGWKILYKNKLDELKKEKLAQYFTLDYIDDDNIPELIIIGDFMHAAAVNVFTVKNDELVELPLYSSGTTFGYIKNSGYIIDCEYGGASMITVYKMNDSDAEEYDSFGMRFDGSCYDSSGKSITESEFNSKLDLYVKNQNYVSVSSLEKNKKYYKISGTSFVAVLDIE